MSSVLIESSITNAIIKQNSKVYGDNSNKSSIIFNLPENSKVTIIDSSINYYYKILYTDTENSEEIEGYISKRNASIK